LRSARLFELQREKAELLQRLRIGSIDDAEARQVAPHCHRSRRGFFGAAAGRCARVTAWGLLVQRIELLRSELQRVDSHARRW
jgi:hypothetical protein